MFRTATPTPAPSIPNAPRKPLVSRWRAGLGLLVAAVVAGGLGDQGVTGKPQVAAALAAFLLWVFPRAGVAVAGFLAGTVVPAAFLLVAVTVQHLREGRFRYHLRVFPLAALAWYRAPWTPWAWVALAVAVDAWHCWRAPKRWFSAREQRVLARGFALAAGWQLATGGLPVRAQVASFALVLPVAAVPWWRGRAWRSETPAGPHPLEVEWDEDVAQDPYAGALAGSVLTVDEDAGVYRLRVPRGVLSDDVVASAKLAASLLRGRHRGAVTISEDPHGDALDFIVGFPQRTAVAQVRYWDWKAAVA